MLIKQLADERAWSCGSSAGKDKVRRQLHPQAFVSKHLFVTYPVVVQEYGQILDEDAGLAFLRCGRREINTDPLLAIGFPRRAVRACKTYGRGNFSSHALWTPFVGAT